MSAYANTYHNKVSSSKVNNVINVAILVNTGNASIRNVLKKKYLMLGNI
jgi:hypothetical protein